MSETTALEAIQESELDSLRAENARLRNDLNIARAALELIADTKARVPAHEHEVTAVYALGSMVELPTLRRAFSQTQPVKMVRR